jgi:hypothetical protein
MACRLAGSTAAHFAIYGDRSHYCAISKAVSRVPHASLGFGNLFWRLKVQYCVPSRSRACIPTRRSTPMIPAAHPERTYESRLYLEPKGRREKSFRAKAISWILSPLPLTNKHH